MYRKRPAITLHRQPKPNQSFAYRATGYLKPHGIVSNLSRGRKEEKASLELNRRKRSDDWAHSKLMLANSRQVLVIIDEYWELLILLLLPTTGLSRPSPSFIQYSVGLRSRPSREAADRAPFSSVLAEPSGRSHSECYLVPLHLAVRCGEDQNLAGIPREPKREGVERGG